MTDRPPWWRPFARRRWDASMRATIADTAARASAQRKLYRASRLMREMEPMRLMCLQTDLRNGEAPIHIVDHHLRVIIALIAGAESIEDIA